MFFGQRALEIFKILEEARRKRGEPKVGLEEIRKVAAEAMGEGDKDQAEAEAVVERVSHKKSAVERVAEERITAAEEPSILDCKLEPDSSSAPAQPVTEEVVLYENYEDYLASVEGEEQHDPEITLDTTSLESRAEPASEEVELLRKQLELSEELLKQHKEDIKFYKKKLQMKEKIREKEEEASRIRHQAEMRKKEEEFRAQANAQDNEILKLHSQLAKEKKEKDEAIKKLAVIQSVFSNSQGSGVNSEAGEYVEKFEDDNGGVSAGVKSEAGEYVEKFENDEDNASAGVKREADSSEPSSSLNSSPSMKRRKTTPKKCDDHEDVMKREEWAEEGERKKQGKHSSGKEDKGEKSKDPYDQTRGRH